LPRARAAAAVSSVAGTTPYYSRKRQQHHTRRSAPSYRPRSPAASHISPTRLRPQHVPPCTTYRDAAVRPPILSDVVRGDAPDCLRPSGNCPDNDNKTQPHDPQGSISVTYQAVVELTRVEPLAARDAVQHVIVRTMAESLPNLWPGPCAAKLLWSSGIDSSIQYQVPYIGMN